MCDPQDYGLSDVSLREEKTGVVHNKNLERRTR